MLRKLNGLSGLSHTYPVSIGLDVDDVSKEIIFRFARQDQNIYRLLAGTHNDYGTAINTVWELAQTPFDSKGEVFHHGGIRMRVAGQGNLDLIVTALRWLTKSGIAFRPVSLQVLVSIG